MAKSGVLKKSCFNRNHPITNLSLKSTNIREKPYIVMGGMLGAEKTLVLKILDVRTFEELKNVSVSLDFYEPRDIGFVNLEITFWDQISGIKDFDL